MLIAREKGFFARTYEVLHDDAVVANLDMSSWKEAATVQLDGRSYRFEREGAMSGSFLLLDVQNVVAHAEKPSAFKDRFEITCFSTCYELRKPSVWKSRFELESNGQVVGSISPEGFFRKTIEIDLPEELPLIFRIFIFWLALIILKRQQTAVIASG